MWFYAFKIAVTTMLVVLVSEISARGGKIGSLLASIPLVSWIAYWWIYYQKGRDATQLISMSHDIVWLVLASLPFFMVLPLLLKRGVGFALSMLISTAVMMLCYLLILYLLKFFGSN